MLVLGTLLLIFIAILVAVIAGVVALLKAVGRSKHPRIGFTVITLLLIGSLALLTINLLPKPPLRFSAAAPVPASLTVYFVQNNLGSGTPVYADLDALRVKNGSPRFVRTYPVAATSTFVMIDVFGDDVLYTQEQRFTNSTLSTTVRALRPNDGSEIWEKTFSGSLQHSFSKGGVLYVTNADNGSTYVFALRESDGSTTWQRTMPSQDASLPSGGVVAYDNGIIYLSSLRASQESTSFISALRASDGTVLWQSTRFDSNSVGVSVDSGIVFIDNEEPFGERTLYALHGDTGKLSWQTLIAGLATGANGVVYTSQPVGAVTPGSLVTTKLVALQATDGKVLWQLTGDYAPNSLQLADSAVYLEGFDKARDIPTINAFRATDGTLLWSKTSQNIGRLKVNNGTVYYSNGAMLLALRAQNGSLLWQQQVADANATYDQPAVIDGVLVVPSRSYKHFCILSLDCGEGTFINVVNATTGALYWRYQVADYYETPVITIADVA